MKIQTISGLLERQKKILPMTTPSIMSEYKKQMEQWIIIFMLLKAQIPPSIYTFPIIQFLDLSGLVVVHHHHLILKLYIQF
jgi:hypothetical protein